MTPHADPSRELQRIQEELSIRRSTSFFARAGISFVGAFMFAGTAIKLLWDSSRISYLGIGSAFIFIALAWYGFFQYRAGKRWAQEEEMKYVRLLSLRRELSLEDPSALLPP